MKIRKSSIYPIILSSVFLISSCHIQNQAYQPYQESPKEVQRQSVVVESLYALLLSSTNSSLNLLDLADNRIKFTVKTNENSSRMAVSPSKKYIMITNKGDGSISTFFKEDNSTISELGTVGFGSPPTDIIFNNQGTQAFVVYEDESRISVLDVLERARPVISKTLEIKDIDPKVKLQPYKIAINKDDNTLYVIDKANASLFIYKTDESKNFFQDKKFSLASEGGKVSPESIICNEDKLYISDSLNSSIIIFNLTSNTLETRISLLDKTVSGDILPDKIVINKDKTKLYVINKGSSTVAVIDLKTNALIKHIALSTGNITAAYQPTDISISNTGKLIYVTNSAGRELSIISGDEDKLDRNIGTTESSGLQEPFSAINLL